MTRSPDVGAFCRAATPTVAVIAVPGVWPRAATAQCTADTEACIGDGGLTCRKGTAARPRKAPGLAPQEIL